jgi:hypothetical protein
VCGRERIEETKAVNQVPVKQKKNVRKKREGVVTP